MKTRARMLLVMIAGGASFAGCRANPPGALETAFITKVKHSVTVRGKDAKNPLAETSANVERGQEAFSHYCAACHGLDGQNTGVPFADRMSPPVPPLNGKNTQAYSDGQLKWIVDFGLAPSGMPGSKGILTEKEIWSIVIYIRHLPAAGALGEPQMYSGDETAKPCPDITHPAR
jgi:mono/diheme cytochrome c family protein